MSLINGKQCWCMINNQATPNPAINWLREQSPKARPGAEYDKTDPDPAINQLYIDVPSADLLVGIETKLVADPLLEGEALIDDLFEQAAFFRIDNLDGVLTGERWMFTQMYRTSQSRLWENNYDDSI